MTDKVKNVGQAATSGIFWTVFATIGGRLASLVGLSILARLLAPNDFGLLAFALTFITYLETVGDLGTGVALVYWPTRERDAAQVTFYINLVTGLFWFGLSIALAPVVARFFHHPSAEGLVKMLAVSFLIKALGNTHDALCLKRMRFKARIFPELGMATTKVAVSVILALSGFGVWSLVWGHLAGVTVWTSVLWGVVAWRPEKRFPGDLLIPLLRYGRGIVAVNVLAAVVHHADLVVVGRMLGATALGLYQIAYRVPDMTVTLLIRVSSKVLFPTFSRLQHFGGRLSDAYVETLRYVSLVTIPASVGLFLLAEPLVRTLFGESWRGAVPLLRVLAVYAGVRSLGTHAGDVLKATGRPGLLAVMGVCKAVILVPTLIYAARRSALSVAVAMASIASISTAVNVFVVCRLTGLNLTRASKALQAGVGLGAILLVVLAGWNKLVGEISAPLALVGGILIGLATCFLVVRRLHPQLLRRILDKLPGELAAKAAVVLPRPPEVTERSGDEMKADLLRVARFVLPIRDHEIVSYFVNHLFVPYSRWQKLALPLMRFPSFWLSRQWLSSKFRRRDRERGGNPTNHGNVLRCSHQENHKEILPRATLELIESFLGNGRGGVSGETPPSRGRAYRWIILRDYQSVQRKRLTVFLFENNEPHPSAILKLRDRNSGGSSLRREFEALRLEGFHLQPGLRGSIPKPLGFRVQSDVEALVVSCLPGVSGYVEMHRPSLPRGTIAAHFSGAAEWLARFHQSTSTEDEVFGGDEPTIDLDELRSSQVYDSRGADDSWYEALRDNCTRSRLHLAASHGDFWIRNLLMVSRERADEQTSNGEIPLPGVVDWEHFVRKAPPFCDLFHFPITYGLNFPWSGSKRIDAEKALRRTFLEKNSLSLNVIRFFEKYCKTTGLSTALLEDLFQIYLLIRLRDTQSPQERIPWLRLQQSLLAGKCSVFSGLSTP